MSKRILMFKNNAVVELVYTVSGMPIGQSPPIWKIRRRNHGSVQQTTHKVNLDL